MFINRLQGTIATGTGQLPKYAQTRKYLYKWARHMVLQYRRISLISSTHHHNCLPAGSQFIFFKTATLLSIWLLHMEAVAEGQQEVLAHPQPLKILCKGAKLHKILKRPGETDVRMSIHLLQDRQEKSLRENTTGKGHWDQNASSACIQGSQVGPRLEFVRCSCKQGRARDVLSCSWCWHTAVLAKGETCRQTAQPPPHALHKTQQGWC